MQRRDLFLVHFRGEPSLLETLLAERKELCVYWGSFLPSILKRNNTSVIIAETLLDHQDYHEIDEFVWSLTRHWYQKATDLGQLAEFDFQIYLFKKIKNLIILSKLISQYNPTILYCCDNIGDLWPVVQLYAQSNEIRCVQCPIQGDTPPPWEDKINLFQWTRVRAAHLLDSFVAFLLKRSQRHQSCIFVDQKLFSSLKEGPAEATLVPCILEGGLRLRLEFLKKRTLYLALANKLRHRLFPSMSSLRFYALWKQSDRSSWFRSQFSFRGVDFYPMALQELRKIFLYDFPRIEANKRRIKEISRRLGARAVLLRNENRELEKTFVVAAKETTLRSIVIQHGVFAIPIPEERSLCDINAVWGAYGVRYFCEKKFPETECVIMGSLEYDKLVSSVNLNQRDQLCKNLRLEPTYPLLILASQRPHPFSSTKREDEQQWLVAAVCKAMERLPKTQLVVKVHPFEDERPLQRQISEFHSRERIRVVKDTELFSLLDSSDLVIVYNSTVGLTAMVLAKPVMAVNLTGYPDTVPYVSSGAAIGVYREEEIVPAIESALRGGEQIQKMLQAQRKFVEDYAFKIDGKSKERVLQLLAEISNRRKTSR